MARLGCFLLYLHELLLVLVNRDGDNIASLLDGLDGIVGFFDCLACVVVIADVGNAEAIAIDAHGVNECMGLQNLWRIYRSV